MDGRRFPAKAKGARPTYFDDDGATDAVVAVVTALASEVWALRERIATIESVLDETGLVDRDAIEGFRPSEPELEARAEDQALRAGLHEASALNAAGDYTFAVNTDDGARLRIDLDGNGTLNFDDIHRQTLDQIAEACGMHKPNLIYYFRNKEEIHVTLLNTLMDEWLDPLKAMDRQLAA